ncbi:MinD-like ATPase involved in chromosome partitioning or flagellar assembly [Micromonospora pattaloongensis]|uniref:MinD-like ATPase involved in chromosome partitioning or flagellar assembly n=1 Tax=Micromonospora pattaloongensis TaxID=405436 RepID=A0A1H3I6L2_9ACTN|nr:hypothetical protein [Micromonospora pattaloongensis]SDY23095.1 MinD-like ATPase involved in chromosome partitioning or flagellar assembly [Micromonospora pattaloongensis]
MVDDYGDQVYVPGQGRPQPTPDVEPFWPPDEVVADRRDETGYPPAAPPRPAPPQPVAGPPTAPTPRPDEPAVSAPRPGEQAAVPHPTGPRPGEPAVADPPTRAWPVVTGAPGPVAAPRPPERPVGLDQPFTLDVPFQVGPGPMPPHDAPVHGGPPRPVPGRAGPADRLSADPVTGDTAQPRTATPAADTPPAAAAPPQETPPTPGVAADGPEPPHAPTSPWAQPPQRPAPPQPAPNPAPARGQARPPVAGDPMSPPQHEVGTREPAPPQAVAPPLAQPAPEEWGSPAAAPPTRPTHPASPYPGPAHPVSPTPGPTHPAPTPPGPTRPGPQHPGPTHPASPHPGPSHPGQEADPLPPQAAAPQPGAETHPGVTEVRPNGAPGVYSVPPAAYTEPVWTPESFVPTAEDFARRRAARPAEPVATMGVRAALNKSTLGLVKLPPGRHEQEIKRDIEMVRRNFGGLRQVTVVNPKGGAGKTVAILLLAMTFGQKRGGYVLAWDNNETQGTLGMRAQQDFHSRTVRDMLRDLYQFQGAQGRVGDLSQYVRSQGEGMFDVLASDESATAGEMLTATAFAEIREVVSRFYKLIFVDTGNNVRAQNWQAAIDATDQLVVTMSARNDSAETAARMLDHLEQTGRQRLVRQAVTVVSMPPSRREIDLPPIQQHFAARTRAVLLAPYERLIDAGEPIRYAQLSSGTRDAWLKIAAAVAEGL